MLHAELRRRVDPHRLHVPRRHLFVMSKDPGKQRRQTKPYCSDNADRVPIVGRRCGGCCSESALSCGRLYPANRRSGLWFSSCRCRWLGIIGDGGCSFPRLAHQVVKLRRFVGRQPCFGIKDAVLFQRFPSFCSGNPGCTPLQQLVHLPGNAPVCYAACKTCHTLGAVVVVRFAKPCSLKCAPADLRHPFRDTADSCRGR